MDSGYGKKTFYANDYIPVIIEVMDFTFLSFPPNFGKCKCMIIDHFSQTTVMFVLFVD